MFRGGLVSWCFKPIQPHRANWGQVLFESITDLVGWVLLYIHRNHRLIRDRGPGWLPRLSHSSWALTVTERMFGFLYLLDAVVIIMMMIVIHYYFLVIIINMTDKKKDTQTTLIDWQTESENRGNKIYIGMDQPAPLSNGCSSFKAWWTIIGGSCHKYHFCRGKSSVAINMCLSQQNACFVATKICLLGQNFCRSKIMFVATKIFCHTFVTTKDVFVMTNLFLQQKWYLWQLLPMIVNSSSPVSMVMLQLAFEESSHL